ncbi:5-formyltetrahydrofolate cyclo-ligase [Castellaniella sp.]|uniref:5-formyltetrahydrofolate cyclo-ligase n=1 Tax=Castellaniella sp. TaxID=1955812 RepID=UPI002AFEADCA|nr:5-formyltetrahydrofolate cyclo-ligase [Castellaniella sp.]
MNKNTQDNAVALRKRLKQGRQALTTTERSRGALLIRGRLYTWLASQRTRLLEAGRPDIRHIAAFWSMPDEPALQPLLHQWADDETLSVSLPVVTAPDTALSFRLWTPDTDMRAGAYGIQESCGPAAPLPDVVLVPTLGYTRHGDRLGYGGGYYDRTLAALRASGHTFTAIGIAWATGDISAEPYSPAPHDIPLDGILTDKGWPVPAPDL